MTFELNKEGRGINHKRVRRLMRVMGIEALWMFSTDKARTKMARAYPNPSLKEVIIPMQGN